MCQLKWTKDVQRGGKTLFLVMSVRVFLEEIRTCFRRLNKERVLTSVGGHHSVC